MRSKYIKTLIDYARKFPSSSDRLVEEMVNKQFSPEELNELWKKDTTANS